MRDEEELKRHTPMMKLQIKLPSELIFGWREGKYALVVLDWDGKSVYEVEEEGEK